MSSEFPSPYQPPNYVDPRYIAPAGRRPGVIAWYMVFCLFMTLLYLCVAGFGVAFLVLPGDMLASSSDSSVEEARLMGVMFMVVSLPFWLFYMIAAFMPRNKAGWIVGVVAIGIGLTSACLWPMTIPLLVFWLKDATRNYYNMK